MIKTDTGKNKNKNKPELSSRKKNLIYLICIIITAGCAFIAAIIYVSERDKNPFVYEKNYDKTLVSLGDVNVTLKDAAYYIMIMEAESDKLARMYNSNDPHAYWLVRFGGDQTVSQLTKKTILELIIRDSIYFLEGKSLGLVPDDARLKSLNENVGNTLKSMTSQQMEFTNFTNSELYNILYRIEIAKLYILHVTSGNTSLTEKDFDTGGSHYESIYKKYDEADLININKKLWDKITLGKLSINRH